MFNWSAFLLYILVMSFSPGPNIFVSMATASKHGFKRALQYNIGVFTGFFILMSLSSYFNLFFFNLLPKIQPVMQVIGAVFMFYLAFQTMTAKEKPRKEKESSELTVNRNLFVSAIAFQFINPKGVLYAITVVSNFIIPYYQSHLAFFLFTFLVSFANFLSTTTWASFGVLFNRFLSKYQRAFNFLMGLLLIYSAISMLGLI